MPYPAWLMEFSIDDGPQETLLEFEPGRLINPLYDRVNASGVERADVIIRKVEVEEVTPSALQQP